MMSGASDVLVLGSGPAGLLAAAACSARGASVVVRSTDPDQRWTNVYGVWPDELTDPELAAAVTHLWPSVSVVHRERQEIPRAYARVDGAAWQEILRGRCAGVRFERGDAREGEGRVVIDATGRGVRLRGTGEATLFQVAWGETIVARGLPDDEMAWMHFGDEGSFLYAMPLGGGRFFVEETLLATADVAMEPLRARLHARLAARGVTIAAVEHVERCVIPLDRPIPPVQPVIGFGAAAAMVLPSSGYLLPRIVADAPAVADAAVRGDADAAWAAIWPAWRRRTRVLHLHGARTIAGLSPAQTRDFFAAFFSLPLPTRRAWLADALSPPALMAAMAGVFARLPWGLRARLVSGGVDALVHGLTPEVS